VTALKSPLTPEQSSEKCLEVCRLAPIVPVLVVEDVAHAKPLARSLVAGGLPALEVTLRTDAALDVIHEMSQVEGAVTGAGTLLTPKNVEDVIAAGAQFGVSPGATPELIDAALELGLPLLCGVATCSEVMTLLARGITVAKFFPAEANGGAKALKAISGPLPQMRFCPTGGISLANAPDYLALSNVVCAGGSWVAPKSAMIDGNWHEVERLAREAAQLG